MVACITGFAPGEKPIPCGDEKQQKIIKELQGIKAGPELL
jgi:hypothetical protein